MNKLILTLFFIAALPVVIKAQDAASTQKPETEYPMLENKLKRSNSDIEDPKKNITSKFWISRADLMMDIYEVNRKYIDGQPMLSIKFYFGTEKEIKKEEKDGKLYETYVYDRVNVVFENGITYNYIETRPIHENPLPVALEAMAKAEEFNTDGKQTKKIVANYTRLSDLLVHKGGRAYYFDRDNKTAFDCFAASIDISAKAINGGKSDTTLIYNAGYIAHQAGMTDESLKYLTKAKELNYAEPKIYAFLKQDYFAKGDTATGVEMLKEGFSKYPESQDIVIEFINYFLITGQTNAALDYIKIAQEGDPSNVTLIFAEGTLYDKMGEAEKAVAIYKKCIELNPEYFDAYFNLGVVYYYYAQDIYKEASQASNKDFAAITARGDEQLKNAIEPLEKCVSMLESNPKISADERKTLTTVYETLKSIYYRFKMNDKYEEVKRKLES